MGMPWYAGYPSGIRPSQGFGAVVQTQRLQRSLGLSAGALIREFKTWMGIQRLRRKSLQEITVRSGLVKFDML